MSKGSGFRVQGSEEAIIRAVQVKLGIDDDGVAGPETWAAIFKAVENAERPTPNAERRTEAPEPRTLNPESCDARSEACIATLHPAVRELARRFIHSLNAALPNSTKAKIISGLRSYQEQDELYAQGRTKPGRIVTNARGGFSNHNFGVAFDIGIFRDGQYLEESPAYDRAGTIGKTLGFSWGGDWHGIQDKPHFELRPVWAREMSEKELIANLRLRKQEGRAFFA